MKINLNTTALKKLLIKQRMTTAQLARLMGTSPTGTAKILKRGSCSSANAGLLADALGVDIEDIWKED